MYAQDRVDLLPSTTEHSLRDKLLKKKLLVEEPTGNFADRPFCILRELGRHFEITLFCIFLIKLHLIDNWNNRKRCKTE